MGPRDAFFVKERLTGQRGSIHRSPCEALTDGYVSEVMIVTCAPITWEVVEHAGHEGFLLLHFVLETDPLEPSALGMVTLPVNPDRVADGGVIISGRGPLWLFAHLATRLRSARWIGVYDPRFEGAVVVAAAADSHVQPGDVVDCAPPHSPQPNGSNDSGQTGGPVGNESLRLGVCQDGRRPGAVLLTLQGVGGGRALHPRVIREADSWGTLDAALIRSPSLLVFSSQYPVWLICAVVLRVCKLAPRTALSVYDPKRAAAVVVGGTSSGAIPTGVEIPDERRCDPVPMVAFIGDPNSGKSVLTWKLYRALLDRGVRTYRFDCDASAPTPAYAMDSPMGQVIRRQYKARRGDWRADDVASLIGAVEHIRGSLLDHALLDMPGGIHRDVEIPVRIPANRRNLFRLVDSFVLLARDRQCEAGWMDALAELDLHEKIIAIIRPCPDRSTVESCPSAGGQVQNPPEWIIHELDRERLHVRTEGVRSLASWLHDRLSAGRIARR